MKLALRGIMDKDGDIHSWPMLAMDHKFFFGALRGIETGIRVRWRQWEPEGKIDFDPGATPEDQAAVEAYVQSVGT